MRCWCGLREIKNAGEALPYLEIIKGSFSKLAYLVRGKSFCVYTKAAVNLPTCKIFIPFGAKMTSQLTLDCGICSLYFVFVFSH